MKISAIVIIGLILLFSFSVVHADTVLVQMTKPKPIIPSTSISKDFAFFANVNTPRAQIPDTAALSRNSVELQGSLKLPSPQISGNSIVESLSGFGIVMGTNFRQSFGATNFGLFSSGLIMPLHTIPYAQAGSGGRDAAIIYFPTRNLDRDFDP